LHQLRAIEAFAGQGSKVSLPSILMSDLKLLFLEMLRAYAIARTGMKLEYRERLVAQNMYASASNAVVRGRE
jgi:hypothetical protein